jgi:hypothetical protein
MDWVEHPPQSRIARPSHGRRESSFANVISRPSAVRAGFKMENIALAAVSASF